MMGPEPFIEALDAGAQVVLAGRASDPASWAAAATRAQLPPAPAWYAGKMLECGATPSIPKGHDCLFVTVRDDHVECEPTNPARRCTPLSIANHSLHENSSPIHHIEPGGMLDTVGVPVRRRQRPRRADLRHALEPGRRSTRSSWRASSWPATARSASAARAIRC